MGKKCHTEKKKVKSTNSTKKKLHPPKSGTQEGIKDNQQMNIEPSLKELIDLLDDASKIFPCSAEKIQIKFPSELSINDFNTLFKNGLNYAKQNYSLRQLKILKLLLSVLIDDKTNDTSDPFGLKSFTKLQVIFKMDLILTLLSNKKKIDEFGKIINSVENEFKASIEYQLLNNSDSFKNAFLYNKNINGKYSFDNFEKILYSPTVLNAYEKVIKDLYGLKMSANEIKDKLSNFIATHNIYIIMMPSRYYGLTLYDGTIFLNQKYYDIFQGSIDVVRIFFTLLHELMHSLSRISRGNTNYFIDTGDFLKSKKNLGIDESGSYFENILLFDSLKEKRITCLEANYLLDPNNYSHKTVANFKKAFIQFRKANEKANSLKFSITKENIEEDPIAPENRCYCAGSRISSK